MHLAARTLVLGFRVCIGKTQMRALGQTAWQKVANLEKVATRLTDRGSLLRWNLSADPRGGAQQVPVTIRKPPPQLRYWFFHLSPPFPTRISLLFAL